MPPWLHEALREEAHRSNISLNSLCIEKLVSSHGSGDAPPASPHGAPAGGKICTGPPVPKTMPVQ